MTRTLKALLLAAAMTAPAAHAAPALMPLPATASLPEGAVPVDHGIAVRWDAAPSPLLQRAAARFTDRIDRLAGVIAAASDAAGALAVHIAVGNDAALLTLKAKEGYSLHVGADGVRIAADGPEGALHALATLAQLVRRDAQGPGLAFAEIKDSPRFPWRGLMLDVSRHFMSVEALRRQIDAMEMVKLDVLHLHLSDGTGFRVESRVLPELTAKGSHGQFYTQGEIRDLVAYAADRGIRVVPEFDVPGHALALLLAHPELAAHMPLDDDANLNHAALDPAQPGTLKLIARLYAEMAKLFPDAYFHAGGDEVEASQWTDNPRIVAYMKQHGFASTQALQATFTAEVQKILAKLGKTMVGWDEVVAAPIPKDVVVEPWRGSRLVATSTAAGHPTIVAAGYYLDLLQPAARHYGVDPYDTAAQGLTRAQEALAIKAGMPKVLADQLLTEPAPPPLSDAQKQLVLGGEAPLWAEIVTEEMLDARLWPRAAAIAERFWSPQSVRDVDDLNRRLPAVAAELEIACVDAQAAAHRMALRLSPGDAEPIAVLAGATRPLQNYTLNRYTEAHGDRLDEIAEIAAPDPAPALRFNDLARRYAAGDHGLAPLLRRQLQSWKDNDAAFARIATVRGLAEARAVSADLASLAGAALAVLDDPQARPSPQDKAVYDRANAQLAGTHDLTATVAGPPPVPAGLLLAILPGIAALTGLPTPADTP